MTRRRKSVDPQVHAQQRDARKRVVEELEARGIHVNYDEQYRIIGAYRKDVFSVLHLKGRLTDTQLFAVRRLEALQALALGHERPEQGERVDSSCEGAPGQNVSQTMIDALGDLRIIYATTGGQSAELIKALLAQQSSILTRWRDAVTRVTKETNDDVMGALIRSACENLAEAFKAFDYRARDRRQRAA